MSENKIPEVSIVVPVYNEEESLSMLHARISEAMGETGKRYECLFVDDGSSDRSLETIKSLAAAHPEVRFISFRKNFGQTAALSAGFDNARAPVIVTLDADLQNDPKDIPGLLRILDEGYDIVSGWRQERQDSLMKTIPSHAANALISFVTRIKLRDSGCTLKAYRKEIIEDLQLYGELHRFIPALASWTGIRIIEVPVAHHPRLRGKSKYGISRVFRVALDLLTVKFLISYLTSPIQIFGRIGLFSGFSGLVFFIVAVVLKVTQGRTFTGNPLFYLFIFMEIIGIQTILIGLLGEVNIRTYHESRKRKTYVVKESG